jgi:hypothetical protein
VRFTSGFHWITKGGVFAELFQGAFSGLGQISMPVHHLAPILPGRPFFALKLVVGVRPSGTKFLVVYRNIDLLDPFCATQIS